MDFHPPPEHIIIQNPYFLSSVMPTECITIVTWVMFVLGPCHGGANSGTPLVKTP